MSPTLCFFFSLFQIYREVAARYTWKGSETAIRNSV